MNSKRIIFPLFYDTFSTFKDPIWYLTDNISFRTIYDEDYGAFIRDAEGSFCTINLKSKSQCIYIENLKISNKFDVVKKICTIIKFVLNNFSSGVPIVLPFAALISFEHDSYIDDLIEIEGIMNFHHVIRQSFSLKSNSTKDNISKYYKVIYKVSYTNPTILFLLERYNTCLTRYNIFDKIVDISISLEALISGTQELKHKFSLYNSFLSSSDNIKRLEAFELLNHLYNIRSGIVHGDINSKDKKKSMNIVKENLDKILNIAKTSINYFLFYLYNNQRNTWDSHLRDLVFNNASRIV